ncbi:MAG: putative transport system permease protein [Acidobacteriaceae bacterium]|jgi:hypothetical protein|nr:putative transport system permease protein [Acidobacteriaceae bacterium]
MFASLLSDLRYALRQMRRGPVLTVTVMLSLGLGIGATPAIFSLIHAVMLKSLPVADPNRLYRIGTGKTCCYSGDPQGEWGIFSFDFYHGHGYRKAPGLPALPSGHTGSPLSWRTCGCAAAIRTDCERSSGAACRLHRTAGGVADSVTAPPG